MSDISVVTLVKDRAQHFVRLLDGVRSSTLAPREVVVVDMSDEPMTFAPSSIPTVVIPLRGAGLPLAAARNRGAEAASGRHLLFLDVDCIPRHNLIATIDHHLARYDELVCAEVRYLGPDALACPDEAALHAASVPHPHRSFPNEGARLEPNAGLFWSLLFGIRRTSFQRLGGFDETYEGYGAEDTDFGFRARAADLPLIFVGGTGAFHQYHGVIDPPLQHFSDIVANARRFHARWGVWPMEGWLAAFAARGLIAWENESFELVRKPTEAEIAAATLPPSSYF